LGRREERLGEEGVWEHLEKQGSVESGGTVLEGAAEPDSY